ncbi:hypothetical protein LTR91_008869 [Friedmanniomyces endolithicus]|uniref:Uncharacterized protein n=1 Tax=Friedmanniomyces endolithicus TaxID=329885 RepID=A0AAN6QUW9_9PEZI|nr:hypothetical protein LTR57_016220 [Friedmanniomyces endolithicus]KAK0990556.1 hypothetical protein LTR91_008869 [Friedmanniomyces endolithicus]KAK0991668.1 hypothetical protein LTS01_008172 [Friedmanniomyces endolithicus]
MPENNVAERSSSRPNGRKRPSQNRVVPAIPLALSKPRQPKNLPKVGGHARVERTPATTAPPSPAVDDVANTNGDDLAPRLASLPYVDSAPVLPPPGTTASRDSAPMSQSSGATPEQSAPGSQILSTLPPPPTSNQQALVSPSSGRKSNGKVDMRPLRTRLPPDFVPSADRQTPQSATSSPQHLLSRRAHHPSTNSIVFGGYDSATSSPAPPQSANSPLNPTQWPPLGSTRPPPFVPSGHAYHNSEPVGRRLHDPPGVPWHLRQGFQPSMYPSPKFQHHAHVPFRYPPREVFTPADESQPNGFYHRSRSQSRTSATGPRTGEELQSPATADNVNSLKYDFRSSTGFPPFPPQPRHNYGQFPQPSQHISPAMMSRSEDAEALRNHVYFQFGVSTLADCHLQIVEHESGSRQYLDAHKMILSRSPTLLDIIQGSEPPVSATLKLQVPIRLQDHHSIHTKPFMDCVRHLYGGPLSALNQFLHASVDPSAPTSNEDRMETVLQYVATAAWLQLPAIVNRAMNIALSLLHWDTLGAVLAFALDGGLGPNFAIEDGSEISCASSDDSLAKPDGVGTPTHDPYATDLLHRLIAYTVHTFPPNFYLDASAPQLASSPRLPPTPPQLDALPASRSDPRLSQIRFGELSSEDHKLVPAQLTTTISSLLLSLPFPLLKAVLEHNAMVHQLGADTVASIMRQVVAEREVRRKRALVARSTTPAGEEQQLERASEEGLGVRDLGFEERVEVCGVRGAGFRLVRRGRGVNTPGSSGAGSEGGKQG